MIPIDILIHDCGEIHAYFEPAGSFAGWWVVVIAGRPDLNPYFELAPAGGAR